MSFEWDEEKRQVNIRKHGIDFRDAPGVFAGPMLSAPDTRSEGEERFLGIGLLHHTVVTVAYTFRINAIRIISMRKATSHERKQYLKRIRH